MSSHRECPKSSGANGCRLYSRAVSAAVSLHERAWSGRMGGPPKPGGLHSPVNMSKRGLFARLFASNQTLIRVKMRLPKHNLAGRRQGRSASCRGRNGPFQGYAPAFPRRDAPGSCGLNAMRCAEREGAGKAGCFVHPQPRVGVKEPHELVTTGTPKQSGLPCAMALTVSCALSPVSMTF